MRIIPPYIFAISVSLLAHGTLARSQTTEDFTPSNASHLINMNFCPPTDLKEIAKYLAQQTGRVFIVDRSVTNQKISISVPTPLTANDSISLYRKALERIGFTLSETQGIIQIVPKSYLRFATAASLMALRPVSIQSQDREVSIDYPEPTEISKIIRDVSKWSGRRNVIDDLTTGTVQIFSPKPISPDFAYRVYLIALSTLGFTELDHQVANEVLTIRMVQHRHLDLSKLSIKDGPPVSMNYPELVDLQTIVDQSRSWLSREVVVDSKMSRRVSIFSPAPVARDEAYRLLVIALDHQGYTIVNDGENLRIMTIRDAISEGYIKR